MKIGIIGPGAMGAALARLWAATGNEVMVSYSRDEAKMAALVAELGAGASWGTAEQASRFGDVVVLTVPWWIVPQAIVATNGALEGKILIDVTNPLKADYSGLAVGTDDSGGEQVAHLSDARVVKAYSTLSARDLQAESRSYGHHVPALMYAGDDPLAKTVVATLIEQTGFRPVDAGPLRSARYLEPIVMLVIELGRTQKLKPEFVITLVER